MEFSTNCYHTHSNKTPIQWTAYIFIMGYHILLGKSHSALLTESYKPYPLKVKNALCAVHKT